MKKLLLFLALVALNFSYIWAQNQNPYDFYFDFPASDGQRLYYKIVDGEAHTAQVTAPSTSTSNPWGDFRKPSGSLEIPATVSDGNGTSYSVTSIAEYAFSRCSSLTSVTIPNSVTSIDEYAFSNCTSLASVTIPSSVTSIHDHSFYGCSGLTSISVAQGNTTYDSRNDCNAIIKTSDNMLVVGCTNTNIPSTVTSIGDYAFHRRRGLSNVTIPNSVTSIGRYAFSGCVDIVSINLPNSVQTISSFAFIDCSGLTSVTIPSSVTSIGSGIFAGCTILASISVDAGNTVYDSRNNCNAIIKISTNTLIQGCKNTTIPNDVTHIYINAFYDQTGLTSISIPNSVTSIETAVFYGCSGLRSITVEAQTVPATAANAFSGVPTNIPVNVPCGSGLAYRAATGWSQFTNIQEDPNSPHYSLYYTLDNTNHTATVYGSDDNNNGRVAVDNCGPITDLVIPSTLTYEGVDYAVTSIGENAFANTALTSIEIPSSVTSIESRAFNGCSSLQSVTFPSSLTSIGTRAFYGSSLQSVTIPSSVTSIGGNAFGNCTNLESVIFNAEACTTMGYQYDLVFDGCPIISSLTIGDGVTMIPDYAFSGLSSLTSVTIPEAVTSIGVSAFKECSSLVDIVFNAVACTTAVSHSNNPFRDCPGTNVTFGNRVTIIPNDFLRGTTTGPTSIVIPNSVETIGANAFYGCRNLGSVTFGNSIETIGAGAFSKCINLDNVTLGNSVTFIGANAFYECSSLSNVTLGNSVSTIDEYAFVDCSSLRSVAVPSSVDSIGTNAFLGVRRVLYCGSAEGRPWGAVSVEDCDFVEYRDGDFIYRDEAHTQLLEYIGSEPIVTIPSTVSIIEANAFKNRVDITSVTIPVGVTSIGDWAFFKCTSLTSVSIPDGVTSIGKEAFRDCSEIRLLSIPNSVTTIGEYAFRQVYYVKYCGTAEGSPWGAVSVGCYLDEGDFIYSDNSKTELLCYIGSDASVTIPNSVTTIDRGAFSGCSGLTSVTIPNSVTTIGPNAFYGCSGLTSVTIPNSVTTIGAEAFGCCSGLTSVTIPNSVTTIGAEAFGYCSGLTSIVICASQVTFESKPFTDCNLKYVILKGGQSPSGTEFMRGK